jgi:deazaflavin-dependent oxidoreductase (nitroreductase family)
MGQWFDVREEGGAVSEREDPNRRIIEEFRANEGKVGGMFEGMPILLVHHTGAKTSTERVNPVAYQKLDNGYAIFGSKGGYPRHPDWYHNLRAHPTTRVEVGTDTVDVVARVAEGDERERIWTTQKERYPGFADYEEKTKGIREIPVIVLEPVG